MDAFFTSVEQRDQPELKGKPIAVGGSGPRSVVAAASYEARRFGVYSAMPMSLAIRRCPNLIIVPHRFDAYRTASNAIRDIFKSLTPLVEPLSLDEAYLDVTYLDLHWEEVKRAAMSIKARIARQTGLTASAGISMNKFLAKIASDLDKPDGLSMILPAQAEQFIDALPIHKFHGIGQVTAEKMRLQGIHHGKDLRQLSELELATRYGKTGRYFYRVVRGIDDRAVEPERKRKSISVERTYSTDLVSQQDISAAMIKLAKELNTRLSKIEHMGRTVIIKVRFHDFTTYTRQQPLNAKEVTDQVLFERGLALIDQLPGHLSPIRLLGLGITGFDEDGHSQRQLNLGFDSES